MRSTLLVIMLSSFAGAQSLIEHSAAAAGGSVGGVAGKKVSDGLSAIFQKVDQQTGKAAKPAAPAATAPSAASNAPLFEVGPPVPKQKAGYPPPPPPPKHAVAKATPPLSRRIVHVPVQPELEQPPRISLDQLRAVSSGMSREAVLNLGLPSARVTMYDDGHLLEIYRYVDRDINLATIRLTDGSVSSVQVR
jgi:hypothetical protein